MFFIQKLTVFLFVLLLYLLVKHIKLKRQIRNIANQIHSLTNENTKKMLDISLVDQDLEQLAGEFNQYFAVSGHVVVDAIRHEEYLKESIANISHDLRTPLTVIMGHLQLLSKTALDEGQSRRVGAALHKAGQMKELIRSFYDLSVLDAGQISMQKEKIHFSNLLLDFLSDNALLFENKKISPEITLTDSSVFIYADRNMVERILQNLLTNAVSYSAGQIKIWLDKQEDGKVIFGIENNIENTENIDMKRLFERFYTSDAARHSESTGLGLAVVKLLVEKSGGQIGAEIRGDVISIMWNIN